MNTTPETKKSGPPSPRELQRTAGVATQQRRNVTPSALLAIEPRLAEFYSVRDLDSIARDVAARLLSAGMVARREAE